MILYQKNSSPFIIRLMMVIFHPGMLVLVALPFALAYLASHEKSMIVNGMYVGIGILIVFIFVGYYLMIRQIISPIVLIEIVPAGLRIDQMKYDRHNDVTIAANEVDLQVTSHRGRKSKRRTSYQLHIRHRRNPQVTFSLWEDKSVIGKILEDIDSKNLIALRPKDKAFLRDYRD